MLSWLVKLCLNGLFPIFACSHLEVYNMKDIAFLLLALTLVFAICIGVQGEIIELFDDDDSFIDKMSGQDTATEIANDDTEFFNGEISIRLEAPAAVNNAQRYNANVLGWSYRIVKNPSAADEARWIMFAWKKSDGEGIMIQFPNNGSWGVQPQGGRYFDGVNKTGWPGIQLADAAPEEWEVQIRDLFDDFGEFTMTGIALTQYDNVGYFDSIYLAWTEDELNRLLTEITPVEPRSKLTTTWSEVKSGM
jgi:hypothetical protein